MSRIETLHKDLVDKKKIIIKLVNEVVSIVTYYNLAETNRNFNLEFHIGSCGNMIELSIVDQEYKQIESVECWLLEQVFREDIFMMYNEVNNKAYLELVSKLNDMKKIAVKYVTLNASKNK